MSLRCWFVLILASGSVTAHAQEPAPPAPVPEASQPELAAQEPPAAPDPSVAAPADSAEAPAAGEEIELSEAELAELGLAGVGDAPPVDTAFKISGFMDFNVMGYVDKRDSEWRALAGRHPAFYMGSFNLYLSKNLTQSVRTFGEVRFSYMPAGTRIPNSPRGEFITTDAEDYADFGRRARWGGIEIERVYLDWAMHSLLTLRVGQFLTPYGIWNVDHGSPTIITVGRPFMIGFNFFPERQTGFELLGRAQVSGHNAIGYHLTLSNGTGPVSEFKDLDSNKALGGRLYWSNDSFGELRIGGSIYYGRDTASTEIAAPNEHGKLVFTPAISRQSDSLGLAADLQWLYRGLHVQGEFVAQQVRHTDGGRVGTVNPNFGDVFIAPVDAKNWGIYGLLGYRFEWFGMMPYFLYQHIAYRDPNLFEHTFAYGVSGGLNIRPVESIVLKVEYLYAKYPNGYLYTDQPLHMLSGQLAWAF